MTEDSELDFLAFVIDGAFIEDDLYMRNVFLRELFYAKWIRAAMLQGGAW